MAAVQSQSAADTVKDLGIFKVVRTEIGQIIVAVVDRERVGELVHADGKLIAELIQKPKPQLA